MQRSKHTMVIGCAYSLLVAAVLVQVSAESNADPSTVQCSQVPLVSQTPVVIQSPGNYPNSYPNDYDGCWVVKSEVPSLEPRIEVIFSAIEAQQALRCAAADYVEVRDGANYTSTLLLRWCGWGHPTTPFVSSGDSLYVYFHTDSSISYGGFEMKAYVNQTAHDISAAAGPVTPSANQNPPSETFANDQQSQNVFRTEMDDNLPLNDPFKETGMKVGIGSAVVVGVCLIGLTIYCLTWYHIQRMKGPWDPLDGVIFRKQIYLGDFDDLIERDAVNEEKPGTPGVAIAPSPEPRPDVATPFDDPHPPPAPVYTEAPGPHPGLIFAKYSDPRPTSSFAMTKPSKTPEAPPLELSITAIQTEPVSARTLVATGAIVPISPISEEATCMTEVSADVTPRVHPPPKQVVNDPTPKSKVRWGRIFSNLNTVKVKSVPINSPYGNKGNSMKSVLTRYQKQFLNKDSKK